MRREEEMDGKIPSEIEFLTEKKGKIRHKGVKGVNATDIPQVGLGSLVGSLGNLSKKRRKSKGRGELNRKNTVEHKACEEI